MKTYYTIGFINLTECTGEMIRNQKAPLFNTREAAHTYYRKHYKEYGEYSSIMEITEEEIKTMKKITSEELNKFNEYKEVLLEEGSKELYSWTSPEKQLYVDKNVIIDRYKDFYEALRKYIDQRGYNEYIVIVWNKDAINPANIERPIGEVLDEYYNEQLSHITKKLHISNARNYLSRLVDEAYYLLNNNYNN